MKKEIVGVGVIALGAILGLHFMGDSAGNGGIQEEIKKFSGRAADVGENIQNIVLPAEGFAGFPELPAFQGFEPAPEGFFGGEAEATPTKKIVSSGLSALQPSYVTFSGAGVHRPGESYTPPRGYMPISGTAPAVGKKTVLPSIQPSQYTGASSRLTAGEMRSHGMPVPSRTQAGLTKKGLATQERIAARAAK